MAGGVSAWSKRASPLRRCSLSVLVYQAFTDSSTATATATVAPTMGLLPMAFWFFQTFSCFATRFSKPLSHNGFAAWLLSARSCPIPRFSAFFQKNVDRMWTKKQFLLPCLFLRRPRCLPRHDALKGHPQLPVQRDSVQLCQSHVILAALPCSLLPLLSVSSICAFSASLMGCPFFGRHQHI